MLLDRNLKILVVSAEVAPFAKTGGLADVAGSLPKALAVMGNDVRIVLPRYREVGKQSTVTDFPVEFGPRRETAIVRQNYIEAHLGEIHRQIPVYFIDNYHYFDREGFYCHPDDGERFAFFCKAVLEMLPRLDFQPDIIHLNDWQAGPIAMLLEESYRHQPFYERISTIFTIHNLQYQGHHDPYLLDWLGVDRYRVFQPEGVEFYGYFNFLKAGLVYADKINTVSRTYAREIQTPEYGERLEGLLKKRAADLSGIVNGINFHEFDPKTDPRIFRNYDADTAELKKENKYALQQEMGLPVGEVPVMGLVSRLVEQKGLDLLVAGAEELLAREVQLLVLGLGEGRYEDFFRQLQQRYPDRVGVFIGFNGVLAQRIYAGADIFLMPSRFEPCGLGQLIALRYGTIPVVRATGGLADTVQDFDIRTQAGNGFVFQEYSAAAFLRTVERALDIYQHHPYLWRRLVQGALREDNSWNKAAAEYLELYEAAMARRLNLERIA